MDYPELITYVKLCRKKSGLTQKQLAQLAGIGKTVVFDIEKGKKTVQINNFLSVLTVLNIQLQVHGPVPFSAIPTVKRKEI